MGQSDAFIILDRSPKDIHLRCVMISSWSRAELRADYLTVVLLLNKLWRNCYISLTSHPSSLYSTFAHTENRNELEPEIWTRRVWSKLNPSHGVIGGSIAQRP
jgi:hypothetical protein